MTPLSALAPGAAVEGTYAVLEKERRLSRRGAPFLSLVLTDESGAARALVFDEPDFFGRQFEVGDRVRVAGHVSQREGRPSIVVRHLRPAPDDGAPLVPRSHRDPDELFGFMLQLADELSDPSLRRLLDGLTGDTALARAWVEVPCTRSGHHAYRGGLVEHTVGLASLVQTLCQWHPRLDPDLLLAAALAHDLGYTRVYRIRATVEVTEEGRLLGHLALGHEIVEAAARRAGLADDRRLALLHAVGWHHGPPPGASPNGASPEALALWRANALESGVKARLEGPGLAEPSSPRALGAGG